MEYHNSFITRPKYMRLLEDSVGLPAIKILIGMRRCGKSTLMEMFHDSKINEFDADRVYYRRFDEEFDEDVPDYRGLIDDVRSKVRVEPGTLILLDEIQDVDEWERAVSTFFSRGADVYITGSNSHLLSTELSTKLSGRYIEIEVLPLCFREYIDFRRSVGDGSDIERLFSAFYREGSLPAIALLNERQKEMVEMIVSGVFNTVFVKDVIERNSIRNVSLCNNVNRFLMKNIGNRSSVRKCSGYLTSKGLKTTPATVDGYIRMLEGALLFHRLKRVDAETRSYLMTSDKFYCNDLGIRNHIVGLREQDMPGILENIVFMELKYRYGSVTVLSIGGLEVDFMAETEKGPEYFQVCYDMSSPDTLEREARSLKSLNDNYPKTIVTWFRYPVDDIDGIRVVPVLDWLRETV